MSKFYDNDFVYVSLSRQIGIALLEDDENEGHKFANY